MPPSDRLRAGPSARRDRRRERDDVQRVLAALGCHARFVLASRTGLVASIAAPLPTRPAGLVGPTSAGTRSSVRIGHRAGHEGSASSTERRPRAAASRSRACGALPDVPGVAGVEEIVQVALAALLLRPLEPHRGWLIEADRRRRLRTLGGRGTRYRRPGVAACRSSSRSPSPVCFARRAARPSARRRRAARRRGRRRPARRRRVAERQPARARTRGSARGGARRGRAARPRRPRRRPTISAEPSAAQRRRRARRRRRSGPARRARGRCGSTRPRARRRTRRRCRCCSSGGSRRRRRRGASAARRSTSVRCLRSVSIARATKVASAPIATRDRVERLVDRAHRRRLRESLPERARRRVLALRQPVDLVVEEQDLEVHVAAQRVDQVVAADRERVAVAGHDPDREVGPRRARARSRSPARGRGSSASRTSACSTGSARRSRCPETKTIRSRGMPSSGMKLCTRREDRVVAAARAPAHLLVGLEVLRRELSARPCRSSVLARHSRSCAGKGCSVIGDSAEPTGHSIASIASASSRERNGTPRTRL